MITAYVVVTSITIAVSAFFAIVDFLRCDFVLENVNKLGIPESWLPILGSLKGAGAAGLLLGLVGVPLIGTAAAFGLAQFSAAPSSPPIFAPTIARSPFPLAASCWPLRLSCWTLPHRPARPALGNAE